MGMAFIAFSSHSLHSFCFFLYILYFSTEGHYGISKDYYCAFLVCMCDLHLRDKRMYRYFQSIYFEIMTGDLGK